MIYIKILGLLIRALVLKVRGSDDITQTRCLQEILLCYKCRVYFRGQWLALTIRAPKHDGRHDELSRRITLVMTFCAWHLSQQCRKNRFDETMQTSIIYAL